MSKKTKKLDSICIDLSPAEAVVLFNELLDVPGGTRLPKIRQLCEELENVFRFEGEKS